MQLPKPLPLRDAETDLVWVIVPWSRPWLIEHVHANFRRQKFPFKKLVLVANGSEWDSTFGNEVLLAAASWGATVLTSDAHQSAAKNTALAEIRKRGGGFTVTMDDDDWYGPEYLTEACGYARTCDVIGKSRHFMSVDGNLWLCGREQANRPTSWLTGGTIACWAETAPEYPLVASGEDAEFCAAAALRGMSIFGTDLYQYLYRRHSKSDHTWKMSHEKLRQYESARRSLDLGAENLRVVTGATLDVEGSVLAPREDADTLAPPPPQGGQVVTT